MVGQAVVNIHNQQLKNRSNYAPRYCREKKQTDANHQCPNWIVELENENSSQRRFDNVIFHESAPNAALTDF